MDTIKYFLSEEVIDTGTTVIGSSDDTVPTGGSSDPPPPTNTFTGTDAADTINYNGGQFTINKYEENDIIKFDSDTTLISSTADSTSKNITLTTNKGTITLVEAATFKKSAITGKKITIVDGFGNKVTRLFGTSTITLTTADAATLDLNLTAYADIRTVDASKRTAKAPVNLIAPNRAASTLTDTTLTVTLKGSKGDDTLEGGSGNAVITSGAGNDTVVYTGGSDIITDYAAGKDVIQFGSGVTFASSSVDTVTKDVLITTNQGTITVNKAAKVSKAGIVTGGTKVTVVDASGNKATRVFGMTTLSIAATDGDTVDLNSTLLKDVTVADAAKRTAKAPIYIIGNSYKAANTSETSIANTIKGGKGADTLAGGSGNDYLTGGSGDDIFVYSGGDDVLSDYTITKTGGDTIKLGSGLDTARALDGYQIVDKDLIIPFSDSDSLTILKGKDKLITFVDDSGTKINALSFTYTDPSIKLIDNEVVYYNFNTDTLTTEQKKKITLIDASKHTSKVPIHIIGDSDTTKAVTLKAGKGADTLDGSTGNSILTGGSGKDLFIYNGGNDTISDYTAGQDTISIVDSDITIVNASISAMANTDVVLTFNRAGSVAGTLTVKNAIKKGKTPQKLTISNNGVVTAQVYGQDKLSVTSTDGDTISAASNANNGIVETIDASKRNKKNPIYLLGNTLDNSLKGGAADDTIKVSSGNNTLTGGKGSDLFVLDFSGTDGTNFTTITDYSASNGNSDTIQIAGGTYSTYSIEGNSVIFGFAGNSSLNVANAKNTFITFVDSAGSQTSMSRVYYDAESRIFTASGDDATMPKYDSRDTSIDPDRILNETIDAGKRNSKNPIYILGNGNDNYIKGGAGADTLDDGNVIGSGTTIFHTDNTLTGGKGKDTFIYHGGNAVVTDYTAGQDVIKIARTDYTTYHVHGDDVVFYFSDTAVSLTVNSGKGKKITTNINNKGEKTDTYSDYEETVLSSADSIVSGTDSDLTAFVSFDATKRTAKKPIQITGNAKDNFIKGGKGADTLSGSTISSGTTVTKTDDTLTGGKGKDIFIYNGGNDVITDYTAGQDTIQIAGVSYSSYYVDDKDVVMSFGTSNTLTILNGKDKSIDFETVNSGTAPTISTFNDYQEKVFAKSDNPSYTADSDVVVIDAAKMSVAMIITGNDKDNIIKGGSKADDINGRSGDNSIVSGKGNDTLRGGSGNNTLSGGAGKDVFVIAAGSNNTITDYTAGQDTISLESGVSVSAVAVNASGSDYIFTLNSSGTSSTLRIVNGIKTTKTKSTPQKITFETFDGTVTSQVYAQKSLSVANTDGDTIDLSKNINATVRVVDASKRSKTGIYIVGNNNSSGNTLIGGSKDDTIQAGEVKTTISGGKGNDMLSAGDKGSSINGGAGNDDIYVTGGNNFILGDAGDDTIEIENSDGGGSIDGGKGNDNIILGTRGSGTDFKPTTITGGKGNDTLTLNGQGTNTITYTTGDGDDEINNYATGDIIRLGSSKTTVTNASLSGSDYIFTIGKGQLKITNVGSSTTVSIADYNGKVTTYTDATKTNAYTAAAYWFVDDPSGGTEQLEVDDLISAAYEFGVVSSDDKGVPLTQTDYQADNELLGVDIKGSGGLVKDKDRGSTD